MFFKSQQPKDYQRNGSTGLIVGAEPFEFGKGDHAILFLHGWTSSPRDLRFLAESLRESFHCRGILFKGHGLYPDDLEDTTWRVHLQESLDAFSGLAMKFPKVSIIGLSYGALLAAHIAVRRRVENIILLSPFIVSEDKIMNSIPGSSIIPHLPSIIRNISKGPEGSIYHPTENRKHIAYHTMPLKPLKSVMECASETMNILAEVTCPALVIHSTRDKTADFQGGVNVLKCLGSQDKRLIALNKSNHIITLDYDRELVETETRAWLLARM